MFTCIIRNLTVQTTNFVSKQYSKSTYHLSALHTGKLKKMENNSTELVEESFDDIRKKFLMYEGGHVTLEKNDETGIATICLDHPERRNAMSGVMMVELRDCVEVLEKWKEGKGVILYGKGGNFCSGGDLNFAKAISNPQGGLDMSIWMGNALERLQKLPMISVCIIQGPSLGGGAEMSLCCDFIIAADDVKYGFVHAKMGIIPAWGGTTRLVSKLGQRKALDMLLTGRILTAKECVDIGLAETIVSSKQSLDETMKWLTLRLQHHHSIIQAIKKVTLNTNYYAYQEALKLEKFIFAPFWGGEINKKALEKNIKHIKQ